MKKSFTLFALGLMALGYSSLSVAATPSESEPQFLFSTEFATIDEYNQWSVVDSNADASTWTYDDANEQRVYYSYHSTNVADDWLISPAITSTEAGNLAINFVVKGSSYGEKLQLFYGNSATVEAMVNPVTEVMDLGADLTSYLCLISVDANETIHLGFHACSDPDKWRLYIGSVNVQFTSNPIDLRVTDILSPVSDFGLEQETVTVKVKNAGGVDVDAYSVAFAVDGELVTTEAVNEALAVGNEVEYTFNVKADLSTPRKAFDITAWTIHPDEVNTANDTCSVAVLHKAPATVPYFMGFEDNEYTDGITFFDLNDDSGNWDLYFDPWWPLSHTGDVCLAYNYDKYNDASDWAILEPITIEEPGYYVLKFWYSGDDTHPEKLAVYYGNQADPAAMTNKIVEYAPFARSAYEESINIFYIDSPQDLYIGFYAFSDKDENWLCVDDVSLEKVSSESVDLAVNGIGTPGEFVHAGSKKDITFAVRSLGIKDVEATVRVKLNEDVVSEENVTILAQENKQFTLVDALASLEAGEYQLAVELVCAEDESVENNVATHNFRVMGTPTRMWDFEDGQLPEEFVFRSEDDGTVNPSAGSEFNEAGWGIFNIQTHPLFGEYMLAGTSWLDGTDRADRWCVLPPFCPNEESYLLWEAASFNPAYLENYSIMVSSNGDDSWYYYTEKEFIAESAEFKTRGISLASYTDTIYVAFRLRSKNCEHLILDNIAFYGGKMSSVEQAIDDNYRLVVNAEEIVVEGVEAKAVVLYDMNGREVARVNGNRLPVGHAAAGVYIVKTIADDKVYSDKVIMR